MPEWQGLILVAPASVPSDLGITRLGNAVAIVAADEVNEGANYIDLTRIVADQGSVQVEFTYPIEGVAGSALLAKVGDEWALSTLGLTEH